MVKRRQKKARTASEQNAITKRLMEASGLLNKNPLDDPEQRKIYYDFTKTKEDKNGKKKTK